MATYLFGIGILVMRTVSAEVVARSDLPAVLHVIGQPQPPLCHVRENQLGVRVIEYLSQLEAGLVVLWLHVHSPAIIRAGVRVVPAPFGQLATPDQGLNVVGFVSRP